MQVQKNLKNVTKRDELYQILTDDSRNFFINELYNVTYVDIF